MVWAEGFGLAQIEAGIAITPETIFDIASTSKQFTATVILLLGQEGVIALDAPLRDYLTDLPGWAERVTLRQMLHHTSGIPDYIELLVSAGTQPTEPATVTQAMQHVQAITELDFEPGSQFSYSNSNYFLFSQVVERATGRPLAEELANRVFEPLGLTAVMDPTAAIHGKARSYERRDSRWIVADSPWEQTGDGAVQTTPTELVRWAKEYWAPTIGGEDLLALRSDGAVDMGAVPGLKEARYGAGIIVGETIQGRRFFEHAGGWGGFVTDLIVFPDEQLAAAVSCNSPDVGDPVKLAMEATAAWRG